MSVWLYMFITLCYRWIEPSLPTPTPLIELRGRDSCQCLVAASGARAGVKRGRSLDKMWLLTGIVISFPPGLLRVSLKRLSGAPSS